MPLALSLPPVRPACLSTSAGHSPAVDAELEMGTLHLWPFQDSGGEKTSQTVNLGEQETVY